MSEKASSSDATRRAIERNVTKRPFADKAGVELLPTTSVPFERTLTRVVSFVDRSCTNTSSETFSSFGTRLVAADENATKRLSAEIAGERMDSPLASTPPEETLTRSVVGIAPEAEA